MGLIIESQIFLSSTKALNYPLASNDAFDHIVRNTTDRFAQSFHHIGKWAEHLVSESHGAELLAEEE